MTDNHQNSKNTMMDYSITVTGLQNPVAYTGLKK